MAVVVATINKQTQHDKVVTWTPLLNGDQGETFTNKGNTSATVQVTGTFGVGGSINLEGSLDGTNWSILLDAAGAAITLTAAGLKTVQDTCLYYRPNVTAGDGTTSLKCILLAR